MLPHWSRDDFILFYYHFWLLHLNFHLIQSSPLPSDLLERKEINIFLSKAQISLTLPNNCIKNSFSYQH